MTQFIIMFIMVVVCSIFPIFAHANDTTKGTGNAQRYTKHEKYEPKTYHQTVTKRMEESGFTNRGTVKYNYVEIDKYNDSLGGDEIGYIDLEQDAHVNTVYNSVIIHGDVDSKKDALAIGKITGKDARYIQNDVRITGDVSAEGDVVELGTVKLKGGAAQRINNAVEISGDIHAR